MDWSIADQACWSVVDSDEALPAVGAGAGAGEGAAAGACATG